MHLRVGRSGVNECEGRSVCVCECVLGEGEGEREMGCE